MVVEVPGSVIFLTAKPSLSVMVCTLVLYLNENKKYKKKYTLVHWGI